MGNAYTTQAKVLDELFDDVRQEVKAKIDGWIEDESRNIDTALPSYSTPFNDTAGTPATPPTIEKATRFLVLDRVLRKVGLLRYDSDGKLTESYRAEGERLIRQLRDGDLVIPSDQL